MLVLALEKQSYNFPFQATISFAVHGSVHMQSALVIAPVISFKCLSFVHPQGSLSCCGNEWWSESRLISILIVFTLRACRQTTAYQLLHTAFTSSETGFFIV